MRLFKLLGTISSNSMSHNICYVVYNTLSYYKSIQKQTIVGKGDLSKYEIKAGAPVNFRLCLQQLLAW